MKILLLVSLVSILSGCAAYRLRSDGLCTEMAAFANSTAPGEGHSVTLETAWGPSTLHPDAIVSRDCRHDGYAPGVRLCGYLMENSSAEFAEHNFLHALSCLTHVPRWTKNYIYYRHLEVEVSAYSAYGVRDGVNVTVALGSNDENGTEALTVGAKVLKTTR